MEFLKNLWNRLFGSEKTTENLMDTLEVSYGEKFLNTVEVTDVPPMSVPQEDGIQKYIINMSPVVISEIPPTNDNEQSPAEQASKPVKKKKPYYRKKKKTESKDK